MHQALYITAAVCFFSAIILFAAYKFIIKPMTDEIQLLRFEQEKLNFRLYVAEQKQKTLLEKKHSEFHTE